MTGNHGHRDEQRAEGPIEGESGHRQIANDHRPAPHDHSHPHRKGWLGRFGGLVAPHSHDGMESVDRALTDSEEGMTALKLSLAVLAATAAVELSIVLLSSSIALLGDTIHNFADALTAVPLGLAFWVQRKSPTKRYTYGYGRAEDLAGVFIVLMIAASSGVAGWEAVHRLIHPQPVHHVG